MIVTLQCAATATATDAAAPPSAAATAAATLAAVAAAAIAATRSSDLGALVTPVVVAALTAVPTFPFRQFAADVGEMFRVGVRVTRS